ncbi:MAG: GxxExxY protein [Ferruginibacter sp.]
MKYSENEIAKIVVDVAFHLHKRYGPGLFESVYEELICYELSKTDLQVERQKSVPLIHETIQLDAAFRADLIIENLVIIEIKSVEALHSIHYKQLQTYLKLTGCKLGLLINFNSHLIKDGIQRVVNRL